MLAAEVLDAVSTLVKSTLGLDYPPERWPDLERGLKEASAASGSPAVEDYALTLISPLPGSRRWEPLIDALTTGETYFFRDPKSFEALETRVLPRLVRDRRAHQQRRLRLWSAGCCTGEEAYSLALALRRCLPDLPDWQVTLLATDLNPRFLHKAKGATYGNWSFRGLSEAQKAALARPVAEGKYEVLPALRDMVSFHTLNLAEDSFPSLATNTHAMDIIFCRNVLMYFSREQRLRVVGKLARCLVDGGWLITSPAEAPFFDVPALGLASFGGVTIFQKASIPRQVPHGPGPGPVSPVLSPAVWPPRDIQSPDPLDVPTAPRAAAILSAPAPPDFAREARRLAGQGRFTEALAACDRAIAMDRLHASHHYLRGVVLLEMGQGDEAIVALRRALYLEADFVIAHFTLGNALQRLGRGRDAERAFSVAERLLKCLPPEALLPESEGLTAGRLLAILTTLREASTP